MSAWPPRRALVVFAVAVAALFVPIRFTINAEFWERLMDAVHVPFFAAFTGFLFAVNPTRSPSEQRRIVMAAVLAAAFAGAVEVIQPLTGRNESFIDFRNGLLGILCATAWLEARRRHSRAALLGVVIFALVVCAFALRDAAAEGSGIAWRQAHFPLLGDFENDAELRLWIASGDDRIGRSARLQRTSDHATRGSHSLQISTTTASWPGVRFLAADQDWSDRAALAFDVFNPGEPFTLSIRIDDARSKNHDDRYNSALTVASGWNHFRLPLSGVATAPHARRLDLHAIRRVLFFLEDASTPRRFDLDNVRLE